MKCYMDTRLNIDRACVWVKVIVGHDRLISILRGVDTPCRLVECAQWVARRVDKT